MDLFRSKDKRTHREKYGEAEEAVQRTHRVAANVGSLAGLDLDAVEKQRVYDHLWSEHGRAKQKLERLRMKGHKEALKLNKKYDALMAQLEKDADAVYDFRRDELGIYSRGRVKRHVGVIVGIISVASFILASLMAVNITGNVIGSNGGPSSNFIFLLIGLVFGIAWLFLR